MAASTTSSIAPIPETILVERRLLPVATGFRAEVEALQKRPLTQQTRAIAVEIDTRAQRFIGATELERIELKKPVLEAGRRIDDFFKRLCAAPNDARAICRSIVGKIDAAEREKRRLAALESARIERERLEAEKQAAVNELVNQAAVSNDPTLLEAAEQLENEPVQATIVKPEEYKSADGYSTKSVPVGTVINLRKLLLWLCDDNNAGRLEAMSDLIEVKQGRLNAYLRQKSPVLFPDDAIKVEWDIASRNAGRVE